MKFIILLSFMWLLCSTFAQPLNDQCVAASTATIGNVINFNTTGATNNGPMVDGADIYHDIWYTLTATSNLRYTVSLCNSSFDTRLAVYEADNCAAILDETHISFNQDSRKCLYNRNSELYFDATAGQTYYIRIGGSILTYYGPGEMLITSSTIPPPPANDMCPNSIHLNILDVNFECPNITPYTTVGSTPEAIPFGCFGEDMKGVWFKFNPGNLRAVQVNINVGNLNDVYVEIYEDCNGESFDGFSCSFERGDKFYTITELNPYNIYYLRVGASVKYDYSEGPFGIWLKRAAPLDNDLCSQAKVISSDILESFDNSAATLDAQIGTSVGDIYKDIWYSFTAPFDVTYSVSTCGTPFDTKLAVYQANNCSGITSLSDIASSDNSVLCVTNYANSFTQFDASAGTKYYIQVGSADFTKYGPGQVLVANMQANLNEDDMSFFQMFPNPTREILNLTFQNDRDKEINLLDHSGRSILNLHSNRLNETIDVTQFESGIYYIEIVQAQGKSIKKLVKN